ncbi:MAG: Rossmann-like and DUF2520 domain-containing protein [Calditrichia bacterium]
MKGKTASSTLYIIGGGRVGASLAYHFSNKGTTPLGLSEVDPERIRFLRKILGWSFLEERISPRKLQQALLVMLAIKDDWLPSVVEDLARLEVSWKGKLVFHTSGVLPASVLQPLKTKGAHIASIHPIYSFSTDPRENKQMDRIWYDAEGDESAIQIIKNSLPQIQRRLLLLSAEQKKAIHLASVFYANFYVALADMTLQLLKNILPTPGKAMTVFEPLINSAQELVKRHGPAHALTGPVKRGDEETIRIHLKYLQTHDPDLLEPYGLLIKRLLPLSGLPPLEQEKIRTLLDKEG